MVAFAPIGRVSAFLSFSKRQPFLFVFLNQAGRLLAKAGGVVTKVAELFP